MNVKVYVTFNTIIKEKELPALFSSIDFVIISKADAIILQDFGVAKYVKAKYPDFPIHISTQGGISSIYGAKHAKKIGASRIVLARETSYDEICEIKKNVDIEIEYFVQGALCVCYSGNCYFSSIVDGNSGNRGFCKQPCRKKMTLNINDKKVEGYNLSPKDLNLSKEVDHLILAGVDSFKIEGRLRSAEYVQEAVRLYKSILDNRQFDDSNLRIAFNRGNYSSGYIHGRKSQIIYNKIQGNIGLKVGYVEKIVDNLAYISSNYRPNVGDGFKIVRNECEIGGGSFSKNDKLTHEGFTLRSRNHMKGDSVHLTLSTALHAEAEEASPLCPIEIEYTFSVGQNAVIDIIWNDKKYRYTSQFTLESARTSSITKEEIETQLSKVRDYHLALSSIKGTINGDIFLAKSVLNGIRREAVQSFLNSFDNKNYIISSDTILDDEHFSHSSQNISGKRTAIILGEDNLDVLDEYDILVIKPQVYASFDYSKISGLKFNEVYLYCPNYFTQKDAQVFRRTFEKYTFDGIYSDGYNGIELANELHVKCFLGTNCNITNTLFPKCEKPHHFAVSKELNDKELSSFIGSGAFLLIKGEFEVMSLVHCPIINSGEGSCSSCSFKNLYYEDEGGRIFEIMRNKMDGCLFTVLNTQLLNAESHPNFNALYNFSHLSREKITSLLVDALPNTNRGHMYRGIK